MATQALAGLPLRKQRQLLETSFTSGQRVYTLYRGIAAFLAEMSPEFWAHLIEHDPTVAFLAETSALPADDDERLTRRLIDEAIEEYRAPWFVIPPRGERLGDGLHKHRPQDVAAFVKPYLQSDTEMSRIWGTQCAHVWGGAKGLNPILTQLAHDATQNTAVRQEAVFAIVALCDIEAIQGLFDEQVDPDAHTLRMQDEELEVPFWYLRQRGHEFSTEQTSDIIRCYGFAYSPDDDRYVDQFLLAAHDHATGTRYYRCDGRVIPTHQSDRACVKRASMVETAVTNAIGELLSDQFIQSLTANRVEALAQDELAALRDEEQRLRRQRPRRGHYPVSPARAVRGRVRRRQGPPRTTDR